MDNEGIDNMREAMGTLPSRQPKKNYSYVEGLDMMSVNMVDCPRNVFKPMLAMACATWGEDMMGSTRKWEKLTPENRFRVILSILTGNTLPQAQEAVQFTFEVNGLTRSCFDQHARVRVGAAFASIGSRDNNKLDSTFIFYPTIVERMKVDKNYKKDVENWIKVTKDLYEKTLSDRKGNWQIARAFLPMSYNHSWVFTQNYLSLRGQCARRLMACEEIYVLGLHLKLRELIAKKSPLLANYLRPACDTAKRCIYHGGAEGLTKYFSSLFASCGRWKDEAQYSEFNHSCSSYDEIQDKWGLAMPRQDQWINYTEDDYSKLSIKDQLMFEEI